MKLLYIQHTKLQILVRQCTTRSIASRQKRTCNNDEGSFSYEQPWHWKLMSISKCNFQCKYWSVECDGRVKHMILNTIDKNKVRPISITITYIWAWWWQNTCGMTSADTIMYFPHNTLALFKTCNAFTIYIPSHSKTDTIILYLPSPNLF